MSGVANKVGSQKIKLKAPRSNNKGIVRDERKNISLTYCSELFVISEQIITLEHITLFIYAVIMVPKSNENYIIHKSNRKITRLNMGYTYNLQSEKQTHNQKLSSYHSFII